MMMHIAYVNMPITKKIIQGIGVVMVAVKDLGGQIMMVMIEKEHIFQ
jgi:hypothetical protein